MVKNLKKLRTQKGISQQQLGTVLGISQQSINKYENHSIEPDISTLIALAEYFDTTIDFLVGKISVEDVAANEQACLSAAERSLVSGYRKLSKTEQICVDTLITTYNSLKK